MGEYHSNGEMGNNFLYAYGHAVTGTLGASCYAQPVKSKNVTDTTKLTCKMCKKTGLPCIWCSYSPCENRYEKEHYLVPSDLSNF